MRELIERGWSAAQAATAAAAQPSTTTAREVPSPASSPAPPDVVAAAARYDLAAVEDALDGLFGRGSFEAVIDDLVLPAVARLGQAWQDGTIDVAAEHLASSAVLRRLSALFDMAGVAGSGRGVLVGLPPGSRHELGALAFAVALRRMEGDVLYVGSDVPAASWVTAAAESAAQAAVIGVVTESDVTPAAQVATAPQGRSRPSCGCALWRSGRRDPARSWMAPWCFPPVWWMPLGRIRPTPTIGSPEPARRRSHPQST